jgi:hypothetical protein
MRPGRQHETAGGHCYVSSSMEYLRSIAPAKSRLVPALRLVTAQLVHLSRETSGERFGRGDGRTAHLLHQIDQPEHFLAEVRRANGWPPRERHVDGE